MRSLVVRWACCWMALTLLLESEARRSAVYEWEDPQVSTSLGHFEEEVTY